MQAVELDRYRSMLFSSAEIPADLRPEIVDGLGGKILESVTLVIPPEALRNGRDHETWLAISREDPRHYEVLEGRDEADRRGMDLVEKRHHVIQSEEGWRKWLDTLKILEGIAANATGVEPPDWPDSEDF